MTFVSDFNSRRSLQLVSQASTSKVRKTSLSMAELSFCLMKPRNGDSRAGDMTGMGWSSFADPENNCF